MRAGIAFLAALGAAHATVAHSREALSSEAVAAYTAGRHDQYQTLLIDQARACDAKAPANSDDCLDLDLLVAQALNSYSYFGRRPGAPDSYGLATTVDAPQDKVDAERLAAKGMAMVRALYLDAEAPLVAGERISLDAAGARRSAQAIATLGFALTAMGIPGLGPDGNWLRMALAEHFYRAGQPYRASAVLGMYFESGAQGDGPDAWRMAADYRALVPYGAMQPPHPPATASPAARAALAVAAAELALAAGKFAEAERTVAAALPILAQGGPRGSGAYAMALLLEARAAAEQGRTAQALATLDQAEALVAAPGQGAARDRVRLARAALFDALDRQKDSIPIYQAVIAARADPERSSNALDDALTESLAVLAPYEVPGMSFLERFPRPSGPAEELQPVHGPLALALAVAERPAEAYAQVRLSQQSESDPQGLLATLHLAATGHLPADAFPRGEDVLGVLRYRLPPADSRRVEALIYGTLMRLSGGDNPALRGNPYALNPIGARQLLKEAEAVVQARVSGMGAWGLSSERELRKYAPLYRLDVQLAWAMSPQTAK